MACLDQSHREYEQGTKALASGQGIDAIETFFQWMLNLMANSEPPESGCFLVNLVSQLNPLSEGLRAQVDRHKALAIDSTLSQKHRQQLAQMLAVSVQGLWSQSRRGDSIVLLNEYVETLIELSALKFEAAR